MSAAGTSTVPVESTVVQAATNRLRSTPLFSDQRMAWLHPPKPSPRAAAPPPPPPLAPTTRHRLDTAAATATVAQRLPPSEARAPDAPPPAATATATTSSVCSGNGDRRQLNWRDSHNNQSAEWSASQDEVSKQPRRRRRHCCSRSLTRTSRLSPSPAGPRRRARRRPPEVGGEELQAQPHRRSPQPVRAGKHTHHAPSTTPASCHDVISSRH